MSEREVRVLYMEQAQKMEGAGSLLEAEKLYLQVGEVSAAFRVTCFCPLQNALNVYG